MTAGRAPVPPEPLPARRSRAWSIVWRLGYRFLRIVDPLIRSWIANGLPGLGGTVELRIVGRKTGRVRRTIVTLLRHGGSWYVGHPDGEAEWTRNAEASGWLEVDPPAATGSQFGVSRVPNGPERDAVIRATWTQQPFPANLLYRAARRHVAAAGVYLRLVPAPLEAGPGEGSPARETWLQDARDRRSIPPFPTHRRGAGTPSA